MSQVQPFHSARPGETVYHNNNKCTEGNNVETYYLRPGTGGKKLCHHCDQLNKQGR